MKKQNKGFTLIELLLAMVILAVLALLLTGNFTTTLKRGRDTQRKNDLNQVQKALEMYYEDAHHYPTFDVLGPTPGKRFCTSFTPTAEATCGTENEYMVKTPKDPMTNYVYKYIPTAGGASYYLYSYIENALDQGSGVNNNGYSSNIPEASNIKCDAAQMSLNCRYYVGSSNAIPLTPIP